MMMVCFVANHVLIIVRIISDISLRYPRSMFERKSVGLDGQLLLAIQMGLGRYSLSAQRLRNSLGSGGDAPSEANLLVDK